MFAVLIALALGTPTFQPEAHDRFDVVECNHVHDQFGLPVLDQLIFRDWDALTNGHRVQCWALMRDARECTEAGEKAFRNHLEMITAHLPLSEGTHVRTTAKYRGEYTGGSMHPRRDRNGGYVVIWNDGEIRRTIHARTFVETFTQYDPEFNDRRILTESNRRGFTQIGSDPQ